MQDYSLIEKVRAGAPQARDLVQSTPIREPSAATLVVVYRDTCPYCRALERTLIDTANAMAKHNRAASTRVSMALVDAQRAAHVPMLQDERINAVPSFFLLLPNDLRARKWSNEHLVQTNRNGLQLTKTIPIDVLLRDLTHTEPSSASWDAQRRRRALQTAAQISDI